jgi:hypothetical protein
MSAPVSFDQSTLMFNEEFENLRDALKEEAQTNLENTAAQTKIIMEGVVDGCAKAVATTVTTPSKAAINHTSPAPVATCANSIIISSVESTIESSIKKTGQKSIDKCVDTTAKKVIDQAIDKSVNTSKSGWNMVYSYFHGESTAIPVDTAVDGLLISPGALGVSEADNSEDSD